MDVLERLSTIKRDVRREERNMQMDMERIEVEKVVIIQITEVIQGFVGSHGKPLQQSSYGEDSHDDDDDDDYNYGDYDNHDYHNHQYDERKEDITQAQIKHPAANIFTARKGGSSNLFISNNLFTCRAEDQSFSVLMLGKFLSLLSPWTPSGIRLTMEEGQGHQ
ncbi:hypothetical protein FRACYDRAFT_253094 [Fragilariopsis cylindrus CCMP1102]|uniref:Uncharacterized protein n=1 Tax=Fragilariopsis cylindrus CCMP1102 TaxID=635003 RepID=A0A1E7EMK1_9STRA|nr:hypothetical protein FRACYDRAFT_253094 [Fragilariopsis cylindrus CCMP1102]|eukprot:OEU06813.1 hypothetical protein FRACYDRAFT_253094 [Fragilariopsis cylindrus CCMP1102]